MALTPSTMLPLGTPAPDFALVDARTGGTLRRDDFADAPALLVAILCNHCPYVVHIHPGLAALGAYCAERGVAMVAISANDIDSHPADAPEQMAALAEQQGFGFPYLFDESQEVAKAFRAACTPEFYLFDAGRKLVYRGQLDDSRPNNGKPVTGRDVRNAIDAVLGGRAAAAEQVPSIGCNIKWKPGNAPSYA